MNIINLTPHSVNYFIDDNKTIVFESVGVARVATMTAPAGSIKLDEGNINLVKQEFGNVEGLPAPENDTYYIVSSIVKSACSDRSDLIVPTDFVRDNGNIIGCKSFYI